MESKRDLNLGLRRLTLEHGVPLRKLAEKLDISYAECMDWWSDRSLALPLSKIRNLVWTVGASDDDLVCGRISKSTVDTGIMDYPERINPHYLDHAFSFTMSSKHIVEFMDLRYGAFITKGILYKLGVHPDYFRTTQNRISIQFFEDILKEFLALGNTLEDVQNLSKVVYLTMDEEPVERQLFPKCHAYADAYHVISEALKSFEENFDYQFEIERSRTRIICRPSEKLIDSTSNTFEGTDALYRYRSSGLGNFPLLCGLPDLKVNVLRCVSQGDPASVYEFNYPEHQFLGSRL